MELDSKLLVDWRRLVAGKGMSEKWDAFKSVMARAQGMHDPVRVKGKVGGVRRPG